MNIVINQNVKSNYLGYKNLLNYYNQFLSTDDDTIILDFTNISKFDLNLFSVLAAICSTFKQQKKKILLRNLTPSLKKKLTQMKFPDFLPDKNYAQNEIGFKEFKRDEIKLFSDYIEMEVLSKQQMPNMTLALHNLIRDSLGEVFGNVKMHTEAINVYCCGQIFQSTHRLDFTIVNMGKTIKENVTEYFSNKSQKYDDNTISWAVKKENTTKVGKTGGLGLSILTEFIALNNGKLQIVSDDEFLELSTAHKNFQGKRFNYVFPGTIVNVEINLNDKCSYALKSEIDENDIF